MAAATTMEWIMPRGAAEASVQLGVGLGVWGDFWDSGGHPGGGLPQLPPAPDKLTISQVGPVISWSSGHVRPCVHMPVGYQLGGGMNIVE